jgi:hypothetical protein
MREEAWQLESRPNTWAHGISWWLISPSNWIQWQKMASLTVSSHSHSHTGIRGRKAKTGKGDNCQGPTFGCDSVLEAQVLALSKSIQKAELIALMCDLQLAAEKLLI